MKKQWIWAVVLALGLTACGQVKEVDPSLLKQENTKISMHEERELPVKPEPSKPEEQEDRYGKIVAEGTCGERTRWAVTEDLVLVLSGQGDLGYWTARDNLRNVEVESLEEKYWQYPCTKVVVEEGVTALSDHCFMNMDLMQEISLPDSLTVIGESAFEECRSLRSIRLPKYLTELNRAAFFRCSGLEEINVADGNISYSSRDGVLYTGSGCILLLYPPARRDTSFHLAGVTHVKNCAFQGCTALESVEFDEGLVEIGYYAFDGCTNLHTIYYPTTYEQWQQVHVMDGNQDLMACQLVTPDEPAGESGILDSVWANESGTIQLQITDEETMCMHICEYKTETTWNDWILYPEEVIDEDGFTYTGYYSEIMIREDGTAFYEVNGMETSGYMSVDEDGTIYWTSFDYCPENTVVLTRAW